MEGGGGGDHLHGLEGRVLPGGEGVDVDEAAMKGVAANSVVVDRMLKERIICFDDHQYPLQVGESRNVTAVDTLLDLARNLFPPNLVQVSVKTKT